jgi:dUTP pyrophosphatase
VSNKTLYYNNSNAKPRWHEEDAGYDLRAQESYIVQSGDVAFIDTGVSLEIPKGYFGYTTGRSSLNKQGLVVHQGVIDAGYRGNLMVIIQNLTKETKIIEKGERIAQLLLMRYETFDNIKEGKAPVDTQRGTNGFGSTNKDNK